VQLNSFAILAHLVGHENESLVYATECNTDIFLLPHKCQRRPKERLIWDNANAILCPTTDVLYADKIMAKNRIFSIL
jgi:hypothetical protein